ncbi:hypothetical protein GFH48_19050 [Streptomyces fagopyri]|uniref:DUF4177 domain-containing protein n=1 Tax=Streptomyces fagopyri TaxID=2662397 RepID=A0A5Q0LEH6_9ACTN|nr:hypothetical protein [Streptomyces fagopyri]QFZ75086.1 hypothetical protein GFH48_19050 [Streptomyces fagopyri]
MGFMNDAKANVAADAARKAREKGQRVLVYKFIEANQSSKSTAPMQGMAEQIEAVEAHGWRLDQMAAAEGKTFTGERVALVCIFRAV